MYRSFTVNAQFLIKKRRKLIYTPNTTTYHTQLSITTESFDITDNLLHVFE